MPADGYHTQEESDLLFVSGKTEAKRKGGERSFSDAINTIKGMSSNQGERGVGAQPDTLFLSLSLYLCVCDAKKAYSPREGERDDSKSKGYKKFVVFLPLCSLCAPPEIINRLEDHQNITI